MVQMFIKTQTSSHLTTWRTSTFPQLPRRRDEAPPSVVPRSPCSSHFIRQMAAAFVAITVRLGYIIATISTEKRYYLHNIITYR